MSTAAEQDELKRKIDELNRTAWESRIIDSDKAYKNSTDAIELSRKINYAKGIADGLCVEGFCYIRKSDLDKASVCLDESISIFESLNDLHGLANAYEYIGIIQRNRGNSAAALESIFKALDLSQQTGFTEIEAANLYQLGVTYRSLANYDKALEYLFKSITVARTINFTLLEAYDLHVIGSIYFETGDYQKALNYFRQGLVIRHQSGDKWGEAGSLDNIGLVYLKLQQYTEAIDHCKRSLEITKSTGDKKGQANALLHLAEIYKQTNEEEQAAKFSNESLEIRKATGDKRGEAEILLFLAGLQNKSSNEVFQYLNDTIKITEEIKAADLLSKARHHLYEQYKNASDFKEAIAQLELHIHLESELHKNTINQKVLNLEIAHKAEEAKKEAEAIRLKNEELTKLNKEIEEQKNKLIIALAELKAAQAQLIQSEKMASLGELTAGIAHEIQNPLNFVNNFSEINAELIEELNDELTIGNLQQAKKIAGDVKANEEKINHHGKRADSIVKSMLQHSRISSGNKELTDMNALVYEYLRLSYHGLRAKDKSFSAKFETKFDSSLEKIKIISQDIGRVILNLLNNAFYAVTERKKQNEAGYEPTVIISTKKSEDKVEIKVEDNGSGIPQKVLDKIFQPFFTTKPTGQGTGLGLSLSYDIVKAHGGELKVETNEGIGTTFLVHVPAG